MYITDNAIVCIYGRPVRNSREGRVVEARKLIREAAFDPEQLEIITPAFDGAWEAIQSRFEMRLSADLPG